MIQPREDRAPCSVNVTLFALRLLHRRGCVFASAQEAMEMAIGEYGFEARTVTAYKRRNKSTRSFEHFVDVALAFPNAADSRQQPSSSPPSSPASAAADDKKQKGGRAGKPPKAEGPEPLLADISIPAKMIYAHSLATKRTFFAPKRVVSRALQRREEGAFPSAAFTLFQSRCALCCAAVVCSLQSERRV